MSLINHAIPSLFNGVSQQAASIRQSSQCELQENAHSSVVEGVHKRHPTTHIAKLTASNVGSAYVHTINRDTTERYEVVITSAGLAVYDVITGAAKTLTTPDGLTYLTSADPSTGFSVLTIADYTIIVNKAKTCAMVAGTAPTNTLVEVQSFSKLPSTGTTGYKYKITGDNTNAFGAYYVSWNGSSYVETVGYESTNTLDATTMPYQLVRNGDGTFTFSKITWKARLVGDEVSNGSPSFIGSALNDVVFFRNRLGFLSGENVIFSRAGDFFNFYSATCTQVLDTDPIDVAVSHTKVSILRHAIPFNRNLLLFSDQTQFVLAANDTLTPKTATVHPTTEFECSQSAKPVASGSNVYFAVDKSGYTGIREYFVANLQLTFDADDVTAHVPKYLPGGTFKLLSSTNEDVVCALTTSERNAVYVYKYYWAGEEKAQSSWSKWILNSTDIILTASVMNTKLYLVVQRSDGVYLEYIDLQVGLIETDLPILIHLDRKVKLTGVYSSGTGLTTWTLPYAESTVQVILGGGFTGKVGTNLTVSMPTTTTVTAIGDYSASTSYIGVPYTMRYRFSPQYYRDAAKVTVAGAVLKIRNMKVFYANTGYFRAEVTPVGRDTSAYLYTGKSLGTSSLILGSIQKGSGVFKFPVVTDGSTAVIDLVNDTHLPSFFQSAEWEGMMTMKSQRV